MNMKNRIEDLKHIRTQVQSIQDQISQVILKMEGKPGDTPPPVEPPEDEDYTLSLWEGGIQNNVTFPAGTRANFVVFVHDDKGRAVEGVHVVFPFPDGEREATTESNGAAGINGYVIQEPIDMEIYVKESPESTLRWKVNTTGSYNPPSGGDEDTPPPKDEKPDERQFHSYPSGNGTQVLVMFMRNDLAPIYTGKESPVHPIDVQINGKWYNTANEQSWDCFLGGDRNRGVGKIFNLPGNFTGFSFAEEQMKISGVNMRGWGWSHFKLLNLHPDFDLKNPSVRTSSPSFWGRAHSTGVLLGPGGWNNHTGTYYWDFHKLLQNNLGGMMSISRMNKTKKVGIFISGRGVNNPNFDMNDNFRPI